MDTQAKRGDLMVYEVTSRDFVIGQGSTERTQYRVGIVTNVTRDGQVKLFKTSDSSAPIAKERIVGYQRCWIASPATIDVDAAAAAWANPWHQGSPGKPFDSLEEIRSTIAPFKHTQEVAS